MVVCGTIAATMKEIQPKCYAIILLLFLYAKRGKQGKETQWKTDEYGDSRLVIIVVKNDTWKWKNASRSSSSSIRASSSRKRAFRRMTICNGAYSTIGVLWLIGGTV